MANAKMPRLLPFARHVEMVIIEALKPRSTTLMGSRTLFVITDTLEYSEMEPALQCRRLRGIRTAGLYTLAGLLDREDTRLKTSSRVRMGLSFVWKTSLAIRILYFLLCNRLHVNHIPLRCLYKPESLVLRATITIIIG